MCNHSDLSPKFELTGVPHELTGFLNYESWYPRHAITNNYKWCRAINQARDRRGRDRMVFGFITTYAIVPIITDVVNWDLLRRGVLNTTLSDKVCQWLAPGRWFSTGTPVSSTNKTDRHNTAEILLEVASNTLTLRFES